MTFNEHEHPRGEAGRFTETHHAEATGVTLSAPSNPFKDADGTEWEFGGDEYTDTYQSNVGRIEARVTTDIREEGARAEVIDRRAGVPKVIARQEHFESLDAAKAHAKGIRERAHKYGINNISAGSSSPWGKVQEVDNRAPGIDAVYTAGHGGLKITAARNKDIDPAWRESTFYEEDCAWSKVVLTHHQDFEPGLVTAAHATARRWYPDQYEAIVGKDPAKYGVDPADYKPVTAAESSIIETREFLAARADTHVRVGRVNQGPEGMKAVEIHDISPDGRDEEGDPVLNARTVLIPEAEFNMPWTERRTIPKNDAYQVVDMSTVEG
jgi:hypothetical protein